MALALALGSSGHGERSSPGFHDEMGDTVATVSGLSGELRHEGDDAAGGFVVCCFVGEGESVEMDWIQYDIQGRWSITNKALKGDRTIVEMDQVRHTGT